MSPSLDLGRLGHVLQAMVERDGRPLLLRDEASGRLHRLPADLAGAPHDARLAMLDDAYQAIMDLIESHDDHSLYGLPWYGTWTRGRMIQFNTSSPYANARTRLRRWLREREAAEHAAGR